jgi:hypothetical protein
LKREQKSAPWRAGVSIALVLDERWRLHWQATRWEGDGKIKAKKIPIQINFYILQ